MNSRLRRGWLYIAAVGLIGNLAMSVLWLYGWVETREWGALAFLLVHCSLAFASAMWTLMEFLKTTERWD